MGSYQRLFAAAIFGIIAIAAANDSISAQEPTPLASTVTGGSATSSNHAVGFGAYMNGGYGTYGFSSVPGFFVILDRLTVRLHVGWEQDILDFAGSADYYFIDNRIGASSLSWFVGPGAYMGYGQRFVSPASAYGIGIRGVAGLRTTVLKRFEAYAAFTPAFGYGYAEGTSSFLWNTDVELGVRFLLVDRIVQSSSRKDSLLFALISSASTLATDAPRARIVFTPDTALGPDVTGWKFQIRDAGGQLVEERSGTGPVPGGFEWDGRRDGGPLPDGRYTASLTATLSGGGRANGESGGVTLISEPLPAPGIAPVAARFAPDAHSKDGRAEFSLSTVPTDALPIVSWTLDILDPDGATLRRFEGKGQPPEALAWDGTAELGGMVPFGRTYAAVFSVTDSVGRSATASCSVAVEAPRTRLALHSAPAFSPKGSPSVLEIQVEPKPVPGALSWSIDIRDASGSVVRTIAGKGSPEGVVWNGKNSEGAIVDGAYTAALAVKTDAGETYSADLPPVLLDSKQPAISSAPDPAFFYTPDGDGVDDGLRLGLSVKNATPVASWSFDAADPTGRPFSHFEGRGALPDSIPWDGKGAGGEVIQSERTYGYELKIVDSVGKTARAKGSFRTGILVQREGDTVRLDLGALNFQPDKSELVGDSSEAGKKNREVMDHLYALLSRLKEYRIRIIGHAVNVSGTLKEEDELKVLSTARADRIKAELATMGLDPSRIETIGVGGTQPVVPHADKANNWKNRRVEFVLTKEQS